jgi:hypothetical protein
LSHRGPVNPRGQWQFGQVPIWNDSHRPCGGGGAGGGVVVLAVLGSLPRSLFTNGVPGCG